MTLVYSPRRLVRRSCGIRTERIEFADSKARVARRLRQQSGVDCQSMPTVARAITAVCTDMHRPYLNAVASALPNAEIVFDKFHVLQPRRRAR